MKNQGTTFFTGRPGDLNLGIRSEVSNFDTKNMLIWVFPKNRGNTPKMDGENNGKPYEQMDDLGVPLFLETPICC